MKKEQTAYLISIAAGLFMAILGFTFSYISNSQSIYLDGMFSLINMAMATITLILSKKVISYKSEKFQFGISQAEPILNVIKALLFFSIMMFSLFMAINALLDGGREMKFDSGIIYALIATVGCLFAAFLISIVEKYNNSPLLAVEKKGWLIDGVLSGAVLIVFGIGYLIRNTEFSIYSSYIDPIMIIILIVLVLPIPLKIFNENFFDLLFSAPPKEIISIIEGHINSELKSAKMKDYYFRMAKIGRFYSIHISILQLNSKSLTSKELDNLRSNLNTVINKDLPNSILTIETTVDESIFRQINEQ